MALNGPYTIEDLLAMTGGKKKRRGNALSELALLAKMRTAAEGGGARKGVTRRPLRLLGIDPGTRIAGWGVVERDGFDRSLSLVDCGCIQPSPKLDLKCRLREIFSELEEVIARTRPDAAALEETFAGVNMKSAIAMGEGRGVALLCLARANLDVLEISPRSIKHAVTGSGASGKAGVAAMVMARLNLAKAPKPADVTDALAAAIALAQRL